MSERRIESTSPRGQPRPLIALLFGNQVTGGARQGTLLYMLLDAARDRRIYARLTELGDAIQARSLYQGDIGDRLAHVSPYLVAVRESQPESLRLAEAGFGRSWGVFITTATAFDDLRRHLRKFNLVYREDGTSLVFRFYDPRVLRRFLPTCSADEARRLFGPIVSFVAESEEGDALIRFTLGSGELMQTRLPVQPQGTRS
jgi:Domain of unknown function (DUF4123)